MPSQRGLVAGAGKLAGRGCIGLALTRRAAMLLLADEVSPHNN
jgi:hypothetical protein